MIHIRFENTDIIRLKNIAKHLPQITSLKRFKAKVAMLIAAQGKKNINEASADGKSSYALLATSTKKQKAKQGYSLKPLTRTGDLIKSINSGVDSDTPYVSAISYAKYHQFGTSKMSARPIFSVRENTQESILKLIENTIQNTINKA